MTSSPPGLLLFGQAWAVGLSHESEVASSHNEAVAAARTHPIGESSALAQSLGDVKENKPDSDSYRALSSILEGNKQDGVLTYPVTFPKAPNL